MEHIPGALLLHEIMGLELTLTLCESQLIAEEDYKFARTHTFALLTMVKEASAFYKRLASCLATKWEQHYSAVLFWLRARITFSLLRSGIQSIRGARSHIGHASRLPPPAIELTISELQCRT